MPTKPKKETEEETEEETEDGHFNDDRLQPDYNKNLQDVGRPSSRGGKRRRKSRKSRKMKGGHHLYKRLGVSKYATKKTIKNAYNKLKKKNKLTNKVKYAYKILSKKKTRKQYNNKYTKHKKRISRKKRGRGKKFAKFAAATTAVTSRVGAVSDETLVSPKAKNVIDMLKTASCSDLSSHDARLKYSGLHPDKAEGEEKKQATVDFREATKYYHDRKKRCKAYKSTNDGNAAPSPQPNSHPSPQPKSHPSPQTSKKRWRDKKKSKRSKGKDSKKSRGKKKKKKKKMHSWHVLLNLSFIREIVDQAYRLTWGQMAALHNSALAVLSSCALEAYKAFKVYEDKNGMVEGSMQFDYTDPNNWRNTGMREFKPQHAVLWCLSKSVGFNFLGGGYESINNKITEGMKMLPN